MSADGSWTINMQTPMGARCPDCAQMRRLQAEGTSFRKLVDDVRREMARSYLSDPELGLAQVAYLLGYADQSAFSNSFRRWTGQSPRRFRSERWQASGVSPPA